MLAMLERHHVLPGVIYNLPPADKAVLRVMLNIGKRGEAAL